MSIVQNQEIRIRLKAFDHKILDIASKKIVEVVNKTVNVCGPIPLPTDREVYTVIRAVHKYKDSREQFEQRTHKRLIIIKNPTDLTMDSISRLVLPSGINIEVKVKQKVN